MNDATKEGILSLDAKLVAATNIAVAEAIWQTHFLKQPGDPIKTSEELVLSSIKQAVKQLEALAKKIVADAKPAEAGS